MKAIAMGLLALAVWAQGDDHKATHHLRSDGAMDFGTVRNPGQEPFHFEVIPAEPNSKAVCALPWLPEGDYECVEYIDETGQRVGVLARKAKAKPVGPTKVIGSTGGGTPAEEQQTTPLIEWTTGTDLVVAAHNEPMFYSFNRKNGDEYLRIELDREGYSIKTATFRLPTSTVALTGEQLTQAVQAWVARRNEKLNEAGWEIVTIPVPPGGPIISNALPKP